MDKLKLAKVDHVRLQKGERCQKGTLHLTQHHLIFVAERHSGPSHVKQVDQAKTKTGSGDATTDQPAEASTSRQDAQHVAKKSGGEIWIPYSLLWLVVRLTSILPVDGNGRIQRGPSVRRTYPLALHLRNFENATLGFETEAAATDVFESLKESVIVESARQLFAFHYAPEPPLKLAPAGWKVYDFKAELARQGVGSKTKAWRICDVNTRYQFAPTYPADLCVPSRISDSTIRYAAKYRSKERIPALTYLHWSNQASITRSSQPLVGLNNRSMQDEKLVEAIFTSHVFADPMSPAAQAASAASVDGASSGSPAMERSKTVAVYGAQTTNLIIDARPTTNAMANRAKGAGTENMEHYKGCKKVYLGIDNIHVMRDSLQRVTDAMRTARAPATFGMQTVAAEKTVNEQESGQQRVSSSLISAHEEQQLDRHALKRSGWLKHIAALLEGTLIVARNVHVNNSHVLIHCSDGWDRTSQLAALAQICLDPYFRTMQGFAVLVEKDWVSFGHRFWDRCGHASSEKYFTTADGYGQPDSDDEDAEERAAAVGGGFDSQAAANAFWGFTKQITANFPRSGDAHGGKRGAHLKEISPVFHQFLDCVWQIMRQYPKRFEFNELWLLDLFDSLYECKYGTFLYNCEAERNGLVDGQAATAPAASGTYSVWDAMLEGTRREQYLNKHFDATSDKDTKRHDADMGVLLPNPKDVGFWGSLFRWDQNDMNSLVKAEAEERKRQLEALERQRELETYTADRPSEEVGPAEVDGVTIGPAVAGGTSDPGLRPGTIDISTSDPNKLAYKPRVRPSSSLQQSRSTSRDEVRLLQNAGNAGSIKATNNRSVLPDDTPLGTQDATNKMKNMFLGWGTRLQDAYASATSSYDGASGSAALSPGAEALPRIAEANYATQSQGGLPRHEWPLHQNTGEPLWRSSNAPIGAATKDLPLHRNGDVLPGEAESSVANAHNPWAGGAASGMQARETNARAGLPDTLQGLNPWDEPAALHEPISHPVAGRAGRADRANGALAPAPPRKDTPKPPRPPSSQPQAVSPKEEKSQDYDPLGVGLGGV